MKARFEQPSIYEKISRYTFFLYLFFVFFGTSLPFQPPVEDIEEKGGSNLINQLVFSSLFLLAMIPLWNRRDKAMVLLKSEKWLTLFLFWCFLTLLWSTYPFISFKRLFQIFTAVVVWIAALLYRDESTELIGVFRVVVLLYVIASILSLAAVPGAIDPKSDSWRGLAPSKNHLGQAALVCVLFFFISFKQGGWMRKWIDGIMLGFSLILLFGAKSVTSSLTLFVLALTGGLVWLNERFRTLGIGHFFMMFTLVIGIAFIVVMARFPDEIESLFQLMGKDFSFTGRTDLWAAVFAETREHFLLGTGFGAFWEPTNPAVLDIYREFPWLPNQAHMGYLDILNETGLIGFILFLTMVASYFFRFAGASVKNIWVWFFLAALIINLQESSLFRLNLLTGVVFLFSYLALHYDTITPKRVKQ
jgi:exopolysaccharide production protein ExoQ